MRFGPLDDLLPESKWTELLRNIELSIDDGSFSRAKLDVELNKQGIPNIENLLRNIRRKVQRSRSYKATLKGIQKNLTSSSGRTQVGEIFQGVRKDSKKLAQNSSYLADLIEQFGVLSLTKKPDNLLMWAHYADSHRGFVIELDSEHSFFCFPKSPAHSALQQVKYVKKREVKTLFCESNDPYKVFRLKNKIWDYEDEWRLVRVLQDADNKLELAEGTIYLFELPEDCITGITLGLNMRAAVKTEIVELIKS